MTHPRRDEWTFVVADSLEKVFPDQRPRAMNDSIPLCAFAGETVSFQIAFLPPTITSSDGIRPLLVDVEATGGATSTLAAVELVPCTLPAFEEHDGGYLRDAPGLYPDLLRPLPDDGIVPFAGGWRAVWVTVTAPDGLDGAITITVTFRDSTTGGVLFTADVDIAVSSLRLPALDIVNTHWFHCDGLADYYGVEVLSEEHWAAIARFLAKATEMSANSVLTPTWTPPLDTPVGLTRRPVQLIDIEEIEGEYRFGFDKLERWMGMCRDIGIEYLEIAHLFTQWGARCAPAIYVRTESGLEHRFGWHTPATDPAYRRLLEQLLPALLATLAQHWDLDKVIFHISDEPHGREMLATYTAARAVVEDLLTGRTIIDALSDYAFYESGVVKTPVIATDAVGPFLENGVDDFWLYYCVAQDVAVANRFVAMPSTRNRVIGSQLFALGAKGFLHWGYNFYNSSFTARPVDPFLDLSSGGRFPAGDAFLVYPGPGGVPFESIRFRVLAEAMTDHRLMQLVREEAGTDAVRDIVDPDGTLSLTSYSDDPDHYRRVRAELAAHVTGVAVR